jgi:glutathione S-transferase
MRKQRATVTSVAHECPRRYLGGGEFSLANIALLSVLEYLHQVPEGAEMATTAAQVESYYRRINERPSARASVPPRMP